MAEEFAIDVRGMTKSFDGRTVVDHIDLQVRSGEIYVVNASAYFSRPGPRIVDSLEILAGILHPDEFPEFVSHGPDDPRVLRLG